MKCISFILKVHYCKCTHAKCRGKALIKSMNLNLKHKRVWWGSIVTLWNTGSDAAATQGPGRHLIGRSHGAPTHFSTGLIFMQMHEMFSEAHHLRRRFTHFVLTARGNLHVAAQQKMALNIHPLHQQWMMTRWKPLPHEAKHLNWK